MIALKLILLPSTSLTSLNTISSLLSISKFSALILSLIFTM
ncbi:hypothetical protein BAZSYMB_SCAFFOLD00028_17 [Bathymodiolus azoricus thioautotrophic gill symbiont]|uniref:Uncharacterized protein n=1 Tax=Bathymodiolus azoricus thioautotrophic gill symbiont TaxID=235205 RepID=A0A1H6KML1_9GAMM|nr:hypothetical protein BAZSYMB_SCAFFOLD00028_17 [Bathymodiolus azoricus thioautotrophic gill symbiont]